jgi:hypothetical protein
MEAIDPQQASEEADCVVIVTATGNSIIRASSDPRG